MEENIYNHAGRSHSYQYDLCAHSLVHVSCHLIPHHHVLHHPFRGRPTVIVPDPQSCEDTKILVL